MKVVKNYWGNHVLVISAINDSTTVERNVLLTYGSFLVARRAGRLMVKAVLTSCLCMY
jgi:hypothetical protein